MDELIATVEIQAELIAKLRRDKARMAQEIEQLRAAIQEKSQATTDGGEVG